MRWFYGLVRGRDGRIHLWEIYEEETYCWGTPAQLRWAIKEIKTVIKDLYYQKKMYNCFYDEKALNKGTEKEIKKWNKMIKNVKFKKLK